MAETDGRGQLWRVGRTYRAFIANRSVSRDDFAAVTHQFQGSFGGVVGQAVDGDHVLTPEGDILPSIGAEQSQESQLAVVIGSGDPALRGWVVAHAVHAVKIVNVTTWRFDIVRTEQNRVQEIRFESSIRLGVQ